ncbi:MAG: lactonase family protein [Leeuwenhoekiella sp.]
MTTQPIISQTLLIGSYADAPDEGIYTAKFDPKTGTLDSIRLVATEKNPSYLAISRSGKNVYAVNEESPGSFSRYAWNNDRSQLIKQENHTSDGAYPCYISLNPSETKLAVANYGGGNIAVYPLEETGKIGDTLISRKHQGSGPFMPNQESAHAHCATFDPSGTYLYAADLGIDEVLAYPVISHEALGDAHIALQLNPGDGPRHIAINPTGHLVFIINELSSTVVSAKLDSQNGIFKQIDRQSTLPENFDGKNACADIHLSSDGRYLYASNRGHNSIAVFAVAKDGSLNLLETTAVEGDWPRNFTLSPDGMFLLVANQRSNNITVLLRDPETGLLSYTGNSIEARQPVFLGFVKPN